MSWRMHLAIVNPEKIATVRNFPKENYLNEEGYTCDDDGENITNEFYKFVEEDFGCKEDYCIGILPINLDDYGEPFYKNPETQDLFEYYHPRIISKFDFQQLIDVMRREALKLFAEAANNDNIMKAMILRRKQIWEAPYGCYPYNLRDDSKEIVCAFNIDYQIFDVVRMYKTVDWNKDVVILFGW